MATPALIFDGDCALCQGAVAWVKARASEPIDYVPCQSNERADRFPDFAEAQCLESMWLVLADGSRYAGEQALPHLFRLLRGWRALAFVFSLPGIRHLSPHVYRWIARHRLQISSLIRKKNPADETACGIDGDCDS